MQLHGKWGFGTHREMMEIAGDAQSHLDGTDDLMYWQKAGRKQSIHTQGKNAHKVQMECFVNSIRGTMRPTHRFGTVTILNALR